MASDWADFGVAVGVGWVVSDWADLDVAVGADWVASDGVPPARSAARCLSSQAGIAIRTPAITKSSVENRINDLLRLIKSDLGA